MQQLTTKIEGPAEADFKLTLPFDIRKKSRFRAILDNGSEVAVILPRGVYFDVGLVGVVD